LHDNHFNVYIPKGNYYVVEVINTGGGIHEEKIESICQASFRTTMNKGIDLLSVPNYIKRNKGFIDIISRDGIGTTVKLYFPKSEIFKDGETLYLDIANQQ